jgi:HK97 family phage prohead protease
MQKTFRAYSVLESKAYDEDDDKMVIRGMASTPSPDRMLDIVEPMGAKFKTPMPLLWQHNHDMPIGSVTFAKPEEKGIPFEAEIPKIKEAGTLKERLDEAMQSIKYKLVTAVSIGFRPIEGAYEYMENGGIRFKEWEWYELSAVTIPANSEAVISAVKSIDKQHLPASGRIADVRQETHPGVSGRRPIQLIPRKR